MIQKFVIAFIGVAALVGIVVATLLFTGPRMKIQPSLQTFEAPAHPLPEGVMLMQTKPSLPTLDEAVALDNPLPTTPENVKKGRTYYGYYCTYCHGTSGAGDGLVGDSYVPRPTDLRQARIAQYSDGQLLLASILGTGHEPVLERIIPEEHRWYLILYVRQLAQLQQDK